MAISFVEASSFDASSVSATDVSISVTCSSGILADDVYVAMLINKSVTANAITPSAGNTASPQTTIISEINDATSSSDDHQYTVIVGKVTTGGAQTYTFTKATDDDTLFAVRLAFFRGVDTTTPVDTTPVGVTEDPAATDAVGFPAFDPTYVGGQVIYCAFYSDDGTTFSAAMSNDTNPDCTIRFDSETNAGSDASLAMTSGSNDGSNIAARTWASNASAASGNTGVVFALVESGAAGSSITVTPGTAAVTSTMYPPILSSIIIPGTNTQALTWFSPELTTIPAPVAPSDFKARLRMRRYRR